jgi:hypothetical protein
MPMSEIVHLGPRATHGRQATYHRGCRCDECKVAQRDYMRRLREEMSNAINYGVPRPKRDTGPASATKPTRHGCMNTYSNWGCRCARCTRANKMAKAHYRSHGTYRCPCDHHEQLRAKEGT